MAFNAGNAFVTVTPRFTGFQGTVRREMGSTMPTAGREAGNAFGKGVGSGATAGLNGEMPALKRAAETAGKTVQSAAERSVKARDTAADAAGKLRIAEEKLIRVRDSGKATPDQLAAAEERVASAQRKVESTSRAASGAQKSYVDAMKTSSAAHATLQKATEQSEKATKDAGDSSGVASKKYAAGWRGVGQRVKGFVSGGVKSAVKSAEKQSEQGGKRAGSGFSSAFKGAIGGLAAGFSIAAVGGFIKDSTDLAGAAEQSIGAVDTVFKENSAVMHQWAADAKRNVGISANEYRELGTLLGSQLKNMGTPMDAIADKTNGLIGMGADMASMFGGTTKEAIEAISSALKGEMDPIEKYGITLSAAALEAEALSKGILKPVVDADKVATASTKMTLAQNKYNEVLKKHGKDSDEAKRAQLTLTSAEEAYSKATAGKVPKLDAESKALAVQSALYGQSADAQGNFMREEDTFEHKRQVAIASWQDLKETLGSAFLPALTTAFGYIGDTAIPFLDNLSAGVKGVSDILFKGDFTAGFREAFGIEEDHPFVNFLFNVREGLQATAEWFQRNESWIKPLTVAVVTGAAAWKIYNLAMGGFKAAAAGFLPMVGKVVIGLKAINATMRANPIGVIITVIAALVGAFIYLWNTNEGFRNFFIGAWDAIKNAVSVAVDWISGALVTMGEFFSSVWDGIKNAVGSAIGFIQGVVGSVVDFFTGTVAPMFLWFYENIILPVWTGIKTAIAASLVPTILLIRGFVWLFENLIAPAMTWLYENIVKPVWNGIKSVISTVWTSVKTTFQNIVNFVRGILSTAFTWLRDTIIRPVWNSIKTAISTVWGGIKLVFQSIVNFVRSTLSAAFTWLRDTVITPVWEGIKSTVSRIWTGLKIIFWAIVNFVRSTLSNAFTWLRDSVINPVWNGIKNTIKSVWDKGIKPIFTALGNFVRDKVAPAFQKGIDTIKGIWNKLKEIAKTPVKFMIEKVINGGLIDSFNFITDFIPGVKKLNPVSLPEGFADGGWTGPGHKYQEAGVVHADEFVVKKSSQRSISRAAPGFLDSLNQYGARALGYATGGLVRPLKGGRVSSGFGASRGKYPHAGQDFATPVGTPIFASMDGTVSRAGWNAITGRTGIGAFLDHPGNRNTYYGHLSRLLVNAGDVVKAGQQIALSGNTGRSTGPHLHFETWTGGKPVNPAKYLGGAMLPEGGEGGGFNPLQSLLDVGGKIKGWITDKFPAGGRFVDAAMGLGNKMFTDLKDWGMGKLASIGDFASDSWGNVKDFFNGKDSGVQSAVRNVANGYGWGSGGQWNALSKLISKESSWNPNAQNPSSTAYGLFQFLNSTWGGVGGSKTSDPALQAKYGMKYIQQRYGDPKGALGFHKKNNWYAEGGQVKPIRAFAKGGLARGLALVGEEGPELANFGSTTRISTADVTSRLLSGAGLQDQLASSRMPEAGLNTSQWNSLNSLVSQAARNMGGGSDAESMRYALHGMEIKMQTESGTVFAKLVNKGVHELSRGNKAIL